MAKIDASQILKAGVELRVSKIDFNDATVKSFVAETKERQEEILKLKRVSKEKLKLVVQLF